jgi:mevalonate kinase
VRDTVRVQAQTDLPAAAGLGCSAALGVAIVRALDAWRGRPIVTPSETVERAMAWERVFHGNPSGVDATAAARGGCIWYERTHGGPALKEVKLSAPLRLAVGHSGIASTTRGMVEHVAKLKERKPELVDRTFEGVRSLVQNARLAIESNDDAGLGRLMDLNQMLLSGLMLSTEEIEAMCRLARDAGALGAKLTGSGGGGCVVALVRDPEPVLAAWEKAGFRSFPTEVAAAPQDGPVGGRSSPADGPVGGRSDERGTAS